jgi:hypothetical protein
MLSVPAWSRSFQTWGPDPHLWRRRISVHNDRVYYLEDQASLRVPSIILGGEQRIQLLLIFQI